MVFLVLRGGEICRLDKQPVTCSDTVKPLCDQWRYFNIYFAPLITLVATLIVLSNWFRHPTILLLMTKKNLS